MDMLGNSPSELQQIFQDSASINEDTKSRKRSYSGVSTVDIDLRDKKKKDYDSWPERNVVHLKWRNYNGYKVSNVSDKTYEYKFGFNMGPIDLMRRTLSLSYNVTKYGETFFTSNVNGVRMVVQPNRTVPENIAKSFIETTIKNAEDGSAILLMPEQLDASAIQLPAMDTNMIALREAQVKEVARIYGIPLYIVGVEKSGINIEAQANEIYNLTVKPHLNVLLQGLTNRYLNRNPNQIGRFSFQIDDTAVTKGNIASIVALINATMGSAQNPQIVTSAEMREKWLGLDPEMPDDPNDDKIAKGLEMRQSFANAAGPDNETDSSDNNNLDNGDIIDEEDNDNEDEDNED